MTLQEQLKEAEQKVTDIKNEINKPEMEFDFVGWCEVTNNDWLTGQNLISKNVYNSIFDYIINENNHHLAEKIITWQIAKYIEKYDNGWNPDWNNTKNKYFFVYDNSRNKVDICNSMKIQDLPNTFYFSEKVTEKTRHLPEILKREYKVCIFKYWLTGER